MRNGTIFDDDSANEPSFKSRRIIKAVEGAVTKGLQAQQQVAVQSLGAQLPMHQMTQSNDCCVTLLSACKFISKRTGACCYYKPTYAKHKRGHLAVTCTENHQVRAVPSCLAPKLFSSLCSLGLVACLSSRPMCRSSNGNRIFTLHEHSSDCP